MTNPHHLEIFHHVARHGGIAQAVRHFPYGITQPTISEQMRLLEEDVGAPLFVRQPFQLTPYGQSLYDFIRPFFSRLDAVTASLRAQRTSTLRVGAGEHVLRTYLPAAFARLRAAHPQVEVAFQAGMQAQIESWVEHAEIDAGITAIDAAPAGLERRGLLHVPLVLLAPKASRIRSAGELWARRSIAEKLIAPPETDSVRRVFQRELAARKVSWPVTHEVKSHPLITWSVAERHGFGVTLAVETLVRHPKVRVLPLPDFHGVEMGLLWRAPPSPLLQGLLEILESLVHSVALASGRPAPVGP